MKVITPWRMDATTDPHDPLNSKIFYLRFLDGNLRILTVLEPPPPEI